MLQTQTIQLAAEALYVHFLIAYMSGAGKRAVIAPVLGWMEEPVTIPAELDAALDHGVASPGTAFHTRRPYQLGFIIEFASAWKALPADRRETALQDPWAFKDVLFSVPMPKGSYTQREALLHLVHPDTFESIVSRGHKESIATAFGRPPAADDRDATDGSPRCESNSKPSTVDRSIGTKTRSSRGGDPSLLVFRRKRRSERRGSSSQVQISTTSREPWSQLPSSTGWFGDTSGRIHVGDRVYLWEAGADAGVAAIADVATEPWLGARRSFDRSGTQDRAPMRRSDER